MLDEHEIIASEPDPPPAPPKRAAWLDALKPVIKPDEDLHRQLTAERKKRESVRYFELCRDELDALFFSAMHYYTLSKSPNNDIQKVRWHVMANFHNGLYLPKKPDCAPLDEPPIDNPLPSAVVRDSDPSLAIEKLFTPDPITLHDTIKQLSRDGFGESFTFDPNADLDVLLQRCATEMIPFSEPAQAPPRVDCPFVICVVGPPCSGKTTICSFILRHFNVAPFTVLGPGEESDAPDAIAGGDDKAIVQTFIREIGALPSGTGALICNYPNTKTQVSSLDKAMTALAKQKKVEIQVNLIFRTGLTFEEVERQVRDRTIRRSTQSVFHPVFNPPNVLELADPEPFIPAPILPDLQQIYDKAMAATAACDVLAKRGTSIVTILCLQSVNQLNLQIENALRQLFDQHEIPVPFTSFVDVEYPKRLRHAKLCFDVLQLWINTCLELWGVEICQFYQKEVTAKAKLDGLEQDLRDQLFLKLTRPDARSELAADFLSNPTDFGRFFKDIWDRSTEIRNEDTKKCCEAIDRGILTYLLPFLDSCHQMIFRGLATRLLLVRWFTEQFKGLSNESFNLEPDVPIGSVTYSDLAEMLVDKPFTQTTDRPFREVFEFVRSNTKHKILQSECRLALKIFDFLVSTADGIKQEVFQRNERLRKEITGCVDRKYSREMEMFSAKFRRLKQGETIDPPLYTFDQSFINKESAIGKLIGRLGSQIPIVDKPITFSTEAITSLETKFTETNEEVISVQELILAASQIGFSNYEVDLLEFIARSDFMPNYIDIKAFLASSSLDKS